MNIMKCLYRLSRVKNRIMRPTTLGARIMLISSDSVLLVKHTYQDFWYLPGGGVNKGEDYESAIRREVYEELGCKLHDIKLFGVYNNFFENKNDSIVIFLSKNFEFTENKNKEIEKHDFFPLNKLPSNVSKGTRRRIDEFLKGSLSCYGKW